MRKFVRLWADRTGSAAVEMGMVLVVIALGSLLGLKGLGGSVTNSFNSTATAVTEATAESR